ncbi:MAG: hypothetical protein AAB945_00625, partial [Patescibacteria group bacterium]
MQEDFILNYIGLPTELESLIKSAPAIEDTNKKIVDTATKEIQSPKVLDSIIEEEKEENFLLKQKNYSKKLATPEFSSLQYALNIPATLFIALVSIFLFGLFQFSNFNYIKSTTQTANVNEFNIPVAPSSPTTNYSSDTILNAYKNYLASTSS